MRWKWFAVGLLVLLPVAGLATWRFMHARGFS
jgi:hypothetical protein